MYTCLVVSEKNACCSLVSCPVNHPYLGYGNIAIAIPTVNFGECISHPLWLTPLVTGWFRKESPYRIIKQLVLNH